MVAENKTRFAVQKILRDAIISGLKYAGFDAGKYAVIESNQRLPTSKQDAILMKMERSRRPGWQSAKFRVEKNAAGTEVIGYYRDDCFLEEQTWTVAVMTRRPTAADNGHAATVDTQLAEDVAAGLIAWFDGPGCLEIRDHEVSILFVSDEPIVIYKDDSSLYEKSASFTVKIIVPKRISHAIPYATLVYDGTKPI